MAEGLLRDWCLKKSTGIHVASAGIAALVGDAADSKAVALMADKGIDIHTHRARQLSSAMIAEHDLILVMEAGHIKAINAMAPQSRGKVHLLGKWNDNEEIADPYRKSSPHFKAALSAIERSIQAWEKYL